MKKRLMRWLKHLGVRYIPSTKMIAEDEAIRLCKYITENYSLSEQLVILDKLKENVVYKRDIEILLKKSEIEKNKKELEQLELNLEKLSVK